MLAAACGSGPVPEPATPAVSEPEPPASTSGPDPSPTSVDAAEPVAGPPPEANSPPTTTAIEAPPEPATAVPEPPPATTTVELTAPTTTTTTAPTTTTTTAPTTTTTPVAVPGVSEPEPEPPPTTTVPDPEPAPAPCPEGQHSHGNDPCHVDAPEPEPDVDEIVCTRSPYVGFCYDFEAKEYKRIPDDYSCRQTDDGMVCRGFEAGPPPDEGWLPQCVRKAVMSGPCIDRDGYVQSVLSQQNMAWGGTYLNTEDGRVRDATSTVGSHPRDHDAEIHRVTTRDPNFPWSIKFDVESLAAIRPAARGEKPLPLPGHRHGHHPEFTPAVQAWSDWCFFDSGLRIVWSEDSDWPEDFEWIAEGESAPPPADSTFVCANQLHEMSFFLSHLDAPEDCILPKATVIVEAWEQREQAMSTPFGSPERAALRTIFAPTDYFLCPNMIYPDPEAVFTPREHYEIYKRYAGNWEPYGNFIFNAKQGYQGVPLSEVPQLRWRREVIGGIRNLRL